MSKKILVPIADGIEEIETTIITDVLRRAGGIVTIASVENSLTITASRGLKIIADKEIKACREEIYDLIVLPGGMPGALHLKDSLLLIDMLKQQNRAGRLYAAICASPVVVLNAHGLLQNKLATCYPSPVFTDSLAIKDAIDLPVVVDQNCVTSQGVGTALAFALKLVEILFGKIKTQQLMEEMLIK